MTLKLILIRHAKSGWDDPFADDHARVLAPRGRADAPVMAAWLARQGHVPDQVLCSDAARTAETLALMLPEWPAAPSVTYVHALYHAAPFAMLDVLHKANGRSVALVGHNPGIGSMACGMVQARPKHSRYADYPTCAVAVIGFAATRWSNVEPGTGDILEFAVPADLMTKDD